MSIHLQENTAILKLIAHPVRTAILNELTKGVKCVSDLQDFLKIRQSNISQHLAVLRHANIIDYFIDGKLRCYFLKSPLIPDLIEVLNNNYTEELPGPECCPVTKKGSYHGERKN